MDSRYVRGHFRPDLANLGLRGVTLTWTMKFLIGQWQDPYVTAHHDNFQISISWVGFHPPINSIHNQGPQHTYSRWTNYSNPGQLYPPRPPNFKVVVFFQGLRRVDKTNQTPQHDISRTHSLTLTFGEGGVFQSFPRGLNILSIYGPGR